MLQLLLTLRCVYIHLRVNKSCIYMFYNFTERLSINYYVATAGGDIAVRLPEDLVCNEADLAFLQRMKNMRHHDKLQVCTCMRAIILSHPQTNKIS